MKTKIPYFPHDCDASRDPKIEKLEADLGLKGYAVFFKILEKMCESSTFFLQKDYKFLSKSLRISAKLLQKVVENYDLFLINNEKNIFYSESFFERFERIKKISTIRKSAINKRWGKEICDTNVYTNESNLYIQKNNFEYTNDIQMNDNIYNNINNNNINNNKKNKKNTNINVSIKKRKKEIFSEEETLLNTEEEKKEKSCEKKEKKSFGENVLLTDEEYNSLKAKYSDDTDGIISVLDNYKGASGKKYKSDYRAILTWCVDAYYERKNKQQQMQKSKSVTQRVAEELIAQGIKL